MTLKNYDRVRIFFEGVEFASRGLPKIPVERFATKEDHEREGRCSITVTIRPPPWATRWRFMENALGIVGPLDRMRWEDDGGPCW